MIVDLHQNTPEWMAFRSDRLGASDASIILGINKWKTPLQLWNEKLGLNEPEQQNFAMTRGHALEDLARKTFTEYTGYEVEPKIFVHPEYNFMMASLDGITEDLQTAVEIKCNGRENHELALKGQIPDYYNAQMQHQMFVCELNWMYYFSFDGKDGVHIIVGREEKFIKNMIEKELEFYRCMKEFIPPNMIEKDFTIRRDCEWAEASKQYLYAKQKLKKYITQEKEARLALIRLSDEKNTTGSGVKLSKIFRKGLVDYKKIPELSCVDLDLYRSDPVISWTLTEIKVNNE